MDRLTPRQIGRIFALLNNELKTAQLVAPAAGEREPTYVARCLLPLVRNLTDRIDIRGVVVSGEGAALPLPVYHLGLQFFPDIVVRYHGQPLIAYEVKYCIGVQRQDQIAKSIGQAMIYRACGYARAGVVILDLDDRIEANDMIQANARLRSLGDLVEIVRRKSGPILSADTTLT